MAPGLLASWIEVNGLAGQFKRSHDPVLTRPRLEDRLADEARFIRTWLDRPGLTGAVSPSGRFLARTMARAVATDGTGPVIELGPGTGPITQALLARGIDPARLMLVEYDGAFCRLLRQRFPGVRVVQGDAYSLRETLADVLTEPAASVVSSLPLLNKPDAERLRLLDEAFELMGPQGSFVQFTYGMVSPVPRAAADDYVADVSAPVWLNLPPARVWIYRRKEEAARSPIVPDAKPAGRFGPRLSDAPLFRPARFRPVDERHGLFRRRQKSAALPYRD